MKTGLFMNTFRQTAFIFSLMAFFSLALLSACQSTSSLKEINEVKLAREAYISKPLESGGLFRLEYGNEIIASPKSEAVCHVPKGTTFSIDQFHYQRYSGATERWIYFFSATGKIYCRNKEYNVKMALDVPGTASSKTAILSELAKKMNRFWYR